MGHTVLAPSRRALTTGLGWSIPVLAVAALAPAAAASPCYAVTVAASVVGGVDQFTVTSGGGPMPAGTTITWQLQNTRGRSDTFNIISTTRLSGNGQSSGSLANLATFTFSFSVLTTTSTVAWVMNSTSFTYSSRVTVTQPGCTPSVVCISGTYNSGFGSTCPTVAAAPLTAPLNAPSSDSPSLSPAIVEVPGPRPDTGS